MLFLCLFLLPISLWKKIVNKSTLTFAEPWQTNIYHHQDFYQLKQIWSTQLFPYIFILIEKHIKLTKHIWKQSSMYLICQQSSPSGQNKIFFPKIWTNRSHEKINSTAMHDKAMCIFTIANKHYHYLDCICFYLGFTIFLQIIFEALGMSFLLMYSYLVSAFLVFISQKIVF